MALRLVAHTAGTFEPIAGATGFTFRPDDPPATRWLVGTADEQFAARVAASPPGAPLVR